MTTKSFGLKLIILKLIPVLCTILSQAAEVDYDQWRLILPISGSSEHLIQVNDVYLQAREALKSLYYDAERTVGEFLYQNPKIERKFNRLPFTLLPEDKKFLSDGRVSINYSIPLTGAFLRILAPKTGGGIPVGNLACPLCKRIWPSDLPVPEGITLTPYEDEISFPSYTGVIIDARHLSLNPCLFPKIYNEEFKEVYGPSFADSLGLFNTGMVAYVSSLEKAYQNMRAGYLPLFLQALKVVGKNRTDLILSNEDALKLHRSLKLLKLLEKCQIVIVADFPTSIEQR